jgi:hypothetical protein
MIVLVYTFERRSDPVTSPDKWPRVVQLTWILSDREGKIADEQCQIVFPDGYLIPSEAAGIPGIISTIARKKGKPLKDVLTRRDFACL